METTLSCCCCLSKRCYKNISSTYYHFGKQEIYSEMLLNTLSISLSCNIIENSLICEECIGKLRDATTFKDQVLQVEKIISKQFSKDIKFKQEQVYTENPIEIKTEPEDNLVDNSHLDDDTHDNCSDDEKTIKYEFLHDNEKETINPRRSNRTKLEYSTKKSVKKKDGLKNRMVQEKKKSLKSKNPKSSTKDNEPSELQLILRENSLKLINNSNLCLFRSLKTHFGCFYCKETFKKIPDLRNHSQSHTQDKYHARSVNRLTGTSCRNVEITSLTCKNCSEPCENLDELEQHLTDKHKINFSNEKHLLIPFRIDDNLSCVICSESFHTYCKLYTHMHKHSNVSVCETCGKSFTSRVNLRMHLSSVHKTHKCGICLEELTSSYAKYKHMIKYHNKVSTKKYHCLDCSNVFKYKYKLDEHRIKEHGQVKKAVICKECGKKFSMLQNLTTHIRAVHNKERNHPCSKCDMRFFTKNDQKRHELSHDTVRSFSCDYCEAKFKTKDSWRRHMKRQHEQLYNG